MYNVSDLMVMSNFFCFNQCAGDVIIKSDASGDAELGKYKLASSLPVGELQRSSEQVHLLISWFPSLPSATPS